MPIHSAATSRFNATQGERRVINSGPILRAYLMRMSFKYAVNLNALEFVCNDLMDVNDFIGIFLGGATGGVTQPVYGYINSIANPYSCKNDQWHFVHT